MKKLLYTSLIALAGLFAASCQQEHIEVVYDPANVTVQTLGVFADAELAADGDALTTTFNPADFKLNVASGYTLYASKAADMADKVKVSSSISIDENQIGHISIKQPAMNSLIFSLGGVAEEPFTVYFQLEGGITNDKNAIIAATVINSNVVAATFTPYSTIILDKDLYPHVYPIGGIDILGSWSHDKVFQFVYDYNKSTDTYTGLLDLGENHADGVQFKFTGEASWDDSTGNWGVDDDSSPEDEASELQLKNGSNTNISQYGKDRFYMFSLNTSTLVLSKKYSFSNVGIVGAFNGWNQADPDMKMTYNIYLHRFYIDQTFAEDTELKFTCDDKWDLNWGGKDGEIAGGGSNIAVEAGSYRVYLDLNHGTYELSTAMYGKDEPTGQDEPEPEPTFKGWGIVGDFSEWGNDVALTENKGVWSGYFTNIEKEGGELAGFKFRKDADWAENYGAPGDVEPYPVVSGEPIKAVAGGKNLGTKGGLFKAVLDLTNESEPTITITEANVFSLIGQVNGANWDSDIEMTEKDGVWTSPVVTIDGEFKIRHNFSWADENTYGLASAEEETKVGEEFELSQPGANMKLAKGDYKVQFTPETKKVLITAVAFPEQLYMIGSEFGGWDWGSDGVVEMTPVLHNPEWGAEAEGQFYTVRYFTAGEGFKFCSQRAWSGDFWGLDENDGFVESGGNCTVSQSGFHLVHIDFKAGKVHVEPARVYGIGDAFGGWDEAKEENLFQADGKQLKATAPKAGALRMYVASAIATSGWWTREFNVIDGALVYRLMDELAAPQVKAGQEIALDFNAGTGSISGEGSGPSYKSEISVPGAYSGSEWNLETAPKLYGNADGVFKGALCMFNDGAVEFKFGHDGSWIGGTGSNLSYTLGAGDNLTIADGVYFWTVNLADNTATALSVSKVGLIGSFNGWSEDLEMTFSAEDKTYSATLTLEADAELKVRFNGNWDYCLGGELNKLSALGGNLKVAEAGSYTAKLDLNKGTLTLTK